MIKSRQVWVYEVREDPRDLNSRLNRQQNSEESIHIVSVCEVSRRSRDMVVLDKFFTVPDYRGKGYATRLLHHIMRSYVYFIALKNVCVLTQSSSLFEQGVSTIVLYVPFDAVTGRCIFRRSGFMECASNEWCEIGFAGTDASYW
jgi:GNAT superfamily N-acetyltransferase